MRLTMVISKLNFYQFGPVPYNWTLYLWGLYTSVKQIAHSAERDGKGMKKIIGSALRGETEWNIFCSNIFYFCALRNHLSISQYYLVDAIGFHVKITPAYSKCELKKNFYQKLVQQTKSSKGQTSYGKHLRHFIFHSAGF